VKYAILLTVLFLAACTQLDTAPKAEDFTVRVYGTMTDDGEIEFIGELLNVTNRKITIQHASPLIQIQVYDELKKPLIDEFITLTIGMNGVLKPGEAYNPDTERYDGGKRTVKAEKSGTYTLVGTASFSVVSSDGKSELYTLESEPYEIAVIVD